MVYSSFRVRAFTAFGRESHHKRKNRPWAGMLFEPLGSRLYFRRVLVLLKRENRRYLQSTDISDKKIWSNMLQELQKEQTAVVNFHDSFPTRRYPSRDRSLSTPRSEEWLTLVTFYIQWNDFCRVCGAVYIYGSNQCALYICEAQPNLPSKLTRERRWPFPCALITVLEPSCDLCIFYRRKSFTDYYRATGCRFEHRAVCKAIKNCAKCVVAYRKFPVV